MTHPVGEGRCRRHAGSGIVEREVLPGERRTGTGDGPGDPGIERANQPVLAGGVHESEQHHRPAALDAADPGAVEERDREDLGGRGGVERMRARPKFRFRERSPPPHDLLARRDDHHQHCERAPSKAHRAQDPIESCGRDRQGRRQQFVALDDRRRRVDRLG